MLRLLAGAIGETDDREPRDARLEVRLDLDLPWLEADECVSGRSCKHALRLTRRRSQVATAFSSKELQVAQGV